MHPAALTYVLLRDAADIPDVHDLPLVPHHAHGNGVLTHLGGNVAVHLDAQVLQHQEPCASQQRALSPGATVLVPGVSKQALWAASSPGPTVPRKGLKFFLVQAAISTATALWLWFRPSLAYLEGGENSRD